MSNLWHCIENKKDCRTEILEAPGVGVFLKVEVGEASVDASVSVTFARGVRYDAKNKMFVSLQTGEQSSFFDGVL